MTDNKAGRDKAARTAQVTHSQRHDQLTSNERIPMKNSGAVTEDGRASEPRKIAVGRFEQVALVALKETIRISLN